jgi:hypothetical protein
LPFERIGVAVNRPLASVPEVRLDRYCLRKQE